MSAADTRRDPGDYYPGGKRVITTPVGDGGGDVKHSDFADVTVETNTMPKMRQAIEALAQKLGATVAAIAIAVAVSGAGFDSVPVNEIDFDENPSVVTNVTFDGLITEHQPLTNYYSKAETDAKIVELAPAPVTSVNSQTGAVHLTAADVGALGNTGDQGLDGKLTIYATQAFDSYISLMPRKGVLGGESTEYARGKIIHGSAGNEKTFTLPSSTGTLSLVSQIYAAVQQIAPEWVSGTSYAQNALVSYNGVVYRKKSSGSSTTNAPATDTTNWEAKKVSELFVPWVDGNIWLDSNKCVSVGGADAGSTQYKYGAIYHDSCYTITLPHASGTIALLSDIPTIYAWAKASTKPSYSLNEICPNSENWLGVQGDAGRHIKVLAGTVGGQIVGGLRVTASAQNDNNMTTYTYGGVAVRRNGANTDYLWDRSANGIARLSDIPTVPTWTATNTSAVISYNYGKETVAIPSGGTLTANLTGWNDGEQTFVVLQPAGSYSVASNVKYCGYGTWPTNTALCVAWPYAGTLYVNPIIIIRE